jgi:hypothetical protein
VSCTKSTNSINEEAVILDGSLESLFAVPGHASSQTDISCKYNEKSYRPHFWSAILVLNTQIRLTQKP